MGKIWYNNNGINGAAGVPRRFFGEMKAVKIKSYAKVNLTLEITGVENGYHNLDSLVANIDLFDLLVLKKRKGNLSFVTMKGMGSESIPPEKNNALKAAEAFSKKFGVNGADITRIGQSSKSLQIVSGAIRDICSTAALREYKVEARK